MRRTTVWRQSAFATSRRRTGSATRAESHNAHSSSDVSVVNNAVRRSRRTRFRSSSSCCPFPVMPMRAARPSSGSASLVTRPRRSSLWISWVIDGWLTPSFAASAVGRVGPSRHTLFNANAADALKSDAGRGRLSLVSFDHVGEMCTTPIRTRRRRTHVTCDVGRKYRRLSPISYR